jgi:hypothetical protein
MHKFIMDDKEIIAFLEGEGRLGSIGVGNKKIKKNIKNNNNR